MAGQPKGSFWLVVWLVILGLAGYAGWKWGLFEGLGGNKPGGDRPVAGGDRVPGGGGGGPAGGGTETMTEAPDETVPTTMQEY